MATVITSTWDIHKNLSTIGRQWTALFALCADDAAFAASAPSVSGWGVAQQVHHVGLELELIAGEIENMLVRPEQAAGLAPTHPFAMRVLEQGHFPRGSGQAPQDVVPPPVVDRAETRKLVESAQKRWNVIARQRDAIQVNHATHPHPILGPFTGLLWLRFIPIHTAHHLRIVRDILNAASVTTPYGSDVENLN